MELKRDIRSFAHKFENAKPITESYEDTCIRIQFSWGIYSNEKVKVLGSKYENCLKGMLAQK